MLRSGYFTYFMLRSGYFTYFMLRSGYFTYFMLRSGYFTYFMLPFVTSWLQWMVMVMVNVDLYSASSQKSLMRCAR